MNNNKGKTITETKKYYSNEYNIGIDVYFEKLVNLEYGFITETPDRFPPLDLEWDSPFIIESSILEISHDKNFNIDKVLLELVELGCQQIQLRFIDNNYKINSIRNLLSILRKSRVVCVELILCYNPDEFEAVKLMVLEFPRLAKVIIHSCPQNLKINEYDRIIHTEKMLNSMSRDIVKIENFIISLETFTEAQKFNIGLNRKVAIDYLGNLKNGINHLKTFGNVNSDSILSIYNQLEFKETWILSNDKIVKCKDCQYRYMCLSNSEIVKTEKRNYKKNDCLFNPYQNTWEQILDNKM